jgi:hypothetical protein
MTRTRLLKVGKSEVTIFGRVEFSSEAEFEPDGATFHYEIANNASEAAQIQWDPVTTRVVRPNDKWNSKTDYSLKGLLGTFHKPATTMSRATVSTAGGKIDIEDVPIYLTSGRRWIALISKIPKAVVEGAKLVVKHYLGGSSPGVVLTAEATQLNESVFQYRYTAAAEGGVPYSVRWGQLSSGNVLVKEPGVEIVIAEFQAPGLVGLLNEFAVMTREEQSWVATTLAPMPFPEQQKRPVQTLSELSHLAHIYSAQYLPGRA